MPIYEYRCRDCGRKASLFFRLASSANDPTCPHCGGKQLDKLMSRVTFRRNRTGDVPDDAGSADLDMGRSEPFRAATDRFGDEMIGDDADPRELARWTRQMSQQMGEPLGADLDRALSDIERGADPDEALDRLEDSEPPQPEG